MGRKRKAEAALGAPGHAKIHVGVSTLKQGKCLNRGLTDNRVAASGKVEAPSVNGNEKLDGLAMKKDAGPLDKHGATSAVTEGTGSPGSPKVARLDSSSLTPQRLWDDFISRRLPAVVSGYPQDPSWRASQLWTLDYLERQAGNEELMVEVRKSAHARFGLGRKERMPFAHFLRRVGQRDNCLYLTTQEAGVGPDGFPEPVVPPMRQLASDVPIQPALLGNLCLQQLNLWIGSSLEGASSGLHHDFHDNLYVLLQGRKRFRLYPPSAAPRMYTQGRLRHIHRNGRIVYEGQGEVLADGSDAGEVKQWERRSKAERELADAEEACRRGDAGASLRLEAAEEAMEQLLGHMLESPTHANTWKGVVPQGGFHDDFDDDFQDSDATSGSAELARPGRKVPRRGRHVGSEAPPRGRAAAGGKSGGSAGAGQGKTERAGAGAGAKGQPGVDGDEEAPPSFSKVDLGLPPADIAAEFPLFPGVEAALEVVLEAGEMLYLPAGWFHEVTSFSSAGPDQATSTPPQCVSTSPKPEASPDKPAAFHMALNYWMHPPDNLTPGAQGFSKPYLSGYWPSVWSRKVQMCPFLQSLIRQQAAPCGSSAAPPSNRHLLTAARDRGHDRPRDGGRNLKPDGNAGAVPAGSPASGRGPLGYRRPRSKPGLGSGPATSAPGPAPQVSSEDSSQAVTGESEPGGRLRFHVAGGVPGDHGVGKPGRSKVRPEGLRAPHRGCGTQEGTIHERSAPRAPCAEVTERDAGLCGCGGPAGASEKRGRAFGGAGNELCGVERDRARALQGGNRKAGAGGRHKRDLRVRFSPQLESAAVDSQRERQRDRGTGGGLGELRESTAQSPDAHAQLDEEAWARTGGKRRKLEGRKRTMTSSDYRPSSSEELQPRLPALTDSEFEDALAEAKDGLDFIDALLRRKLRQGPRGSSHGPGPCTHALRKGGAGSRDGQCAQARPAWLAGRDRSRSGWCQLIALGRRQHLVPFLQGPAEVSGNRTS